ncbi:MAG: hypothetical protein QOJ06_1549 [Pseudonocardiales bacterium]|nr:hypothetical protein [Pseudonocardiales bacterium]
MVVADQQQIERRKPTHARRSEPLTRAQDPRRQRRIHRHGETTRRNRNEACASQASQSPDGGNGARKATGIRHTRSRAGEPALAHNRILRRPGKPVSKNAGSKGRPRDRWPVPVGRRKRRGLQQPVGPVPHGPHLGSGQVLSKRSAQRTLQ